MSFGDVVSVQCTIAGGDLPVNVNWLINGEEIASYLEILLDKRGKRIHVLTIDSVSEKHAGNYTCNAYNNAGVVNHTSELKVNGINEIVMNTFLLFDPFLKFHVSKCGPCCILSSSFQLKKLSKVMGQVCYRH